MEQTLLAKIPSGDTVFSLLSAVISCLSLILQLSNINSFALTDHDTPSKSYFNFMIMNGIKRMIDTTKINRQRKTPNRNKGVRCIRIITMRNGKSDGGTKPFWPPPYHGETDFTTPASAQCITEWWMGCVISCSYIIICHFLIIYCFALLFNHKLLIHSVSIQHKVFCLRYRTHKNREW